METQETRRARRKRAVVMAVACTIGSAAADAQDAGGGSTELGVIPVTAPALNPDGSTAESGGTYVPDQSYGPFGAVKAQDLPFSTNSIPQKLIQDQQAKTLGDIVRNDPSVTTLYPANQQNEAVNIRGFNLDFTNGYRRDGGATSFEAAAAPELIDRVDIYKGLDGFLYGFVSPGGVVNYVTKKPLDNPLTRFTEGYTSDYAFEEALDVSRRFGAGGQFGVRLNVASENGRLPIQFESIQRDVEGLSVDWKPLDGLRVWATADHNYHEIDGAQTQTYFLFPADVTSLPPAPNLTRNYGQPWNFFASEAVTEGVGAEYQDDLWTARASFSHQTTGYRFKGQFPTFILPDETLQATARSAKKRPDEFFGGDVAVTRKLDIGPTRHTLSFAETQTYEETGFVLVTGNGPQYTSSLLAPTYIPEPVFTYGSGSAFGYDRQYQNTLLGDQIDIGRFVTVIGGANWTHTLSSFHFGAGGSSYAAYHWAPVGALLIKPIEQVTAYVSYVQSFQNGSPVTDPGAQNFGASLPPYTSEQYEFGVKAQVTPGLQVNAAVFRINEPLFYQRFTGPTTYVDTEDGLQRNEGFELVAAGKLAEGLTLFGGLTFLDPRGYAGAGYPSGSRAPGQSSFNFRLSGEYALPFVPGLTLLGGVYHTGSEVAVAGQLTAPGFTVVDVGAKYETVAFGRPTVARLYVQNANDARYYDGSIGLGSPLTVKASVQIDF